MKITEVCSETGLTKKAVNWYIQQGLLQVKKDENGYRNFTRAHVSRLQEIHLLRYLDIPTKEIMRILDSDRKINILEDIYVQKQTEQLKMQEKTKLLESLIQNYGNICNVASRLQNEEDFSITEKLRLAFPGIWGVYLVSHFGAYLQEPLLSDKQREAYQCIITWLDNVEIKLPLLLRITQRKVKQMQAEKMADTSREIKEIAFGSENTQAKFLEIARRQIALRKKWYIRLFPPMLAVTHSNKVLRKRLTAVGYYEIFIPAMRRLSREYDVYCKKLEALEQMAKAYI